MRTQPKVGSRSACLSNEELALLMEGKVRREERKRFIAHLDACFDCLEVLGSAASCDMSTEEQAPLTWPLSAWLQLRFSRPLRYGALAASFVVLFVIAWNVQKRSTPERYAGSEALTALLDEREDGVSLGNLLEEGGTNAFAFAMGTSERQRAFRAGVSLVDIRIAIGEGRAILAASRIKTLSSTSETLTSALAANAPREALFEAVEVLEDEITAGHERAWVEYGSWAEVGRLASTIHCSRCLESEKFQRVFEALQSEILEAPARRTLTDIEAALPPGTRPEPDFLRLERAFGQLILLH